MIAKGLPLSGDAEGGRDAQSMAFPEHLNAYED